VSTVAPNSTISFSHSYLIRRVGIIEAAHDFGRDF